MKSILRQLQDEEGVLLMYIAGELPPQDRAEVEQRLAGDPAMRERLETMRGTVAGMEMLFAESDALLEVHEERAIRRAAAGVRELQVAKRIGDAAPRPDRRLPLPWWMYPLAAAASILVAAAVFMANTEPEPMPGRAMDFHGTLTPQDLYVMSSPVLDRQGVYALDDYRRGDELAASFEAGYLAMAEMEATYGRAERDLRELRDSASGPWGDTDLIW